MKRLFLAICLMLLLISCSDDKDDNTRKEVSLTVSEEQIMSAQNENSFSVFRAFNANEQKDVNILISPLSLNTNLSMVANGASGETFGQLLKMTSGSEDGESINLLNSFNDKMRKSLPALDKTVKFYSVNSVWIDNEFPVLSTFVDNCSKYYGGTAKNVNLSSVTAKDEINTWCSKNTNGLIPEFLDDPFSSSVKFAAFNATYFKGLWKFKFNKKNTKTATFTNFDETTSTVDMMSNVDDYAYSETEDYQCVKCPYGNEAFNMYIILPKQTSSADNIINNLNNDAWKSMMPKSVWTVRLKLPKFKVEYDSKDLLREVLSKMGVTDMFSTEKADFSGISTQHNYMSMLKQKTAIIVDEEGTEVAAVTGDGLMTSPGVEIIKEMTVDRPFIYIIQESSTGAVLFMGKVNKL